MPVFDFYHLGIEHCVSVPRALWYHYRCRGYRNDLLASFYQYRHDNGADADCRRDAAVYQLRRFIGHYHNDLCRPFAEHQHEALPC